MFILVFLFLLGTVVTVNSDQPEVEMHSENYNGKHRILTCRAKYFNTSDIILNIKKNHFVLTKEDKVETSGVKPHEDTFWRRDHVIILKSDTSNYSCEVIHAASRFRVEKVWDPDSGGRGRIISSEFIDTSPPDVKTFTVNSKDHDNVFLTCLASGFYPKDITLNIRRNGRLLTREDGVLILDVRPHGDNTFQRRGQVGILKSDKSDYSCEVIHAASGSCVEKVWGQPDVKMFATNSKVQTNVILTCLASGFYPEDITLNIKRNGRILTREDGVETLDVRPNGDKTFQRRDQVEILKSDKSVYTCVVIHAASGSRVEKVWDHHLPTDEGGDNTVIIIVAVVGALLVLAVVLVLAFVFRRRILGCVNRLRRLYTSEAPLQTVTSTPGSNNVNTPLQTGKTESKWSLDSDKTSDSGFPKSERSGSIGSGSTGSGSTDTGSKISTCSDPGNEETSLRQRKEIY